MVKEEKQRKPRLDPLHVQMTKDAVVQQKKKRSKFVEKELEDTNSELDAKTRQKIIDQLREHGNDVEEELFIDNEEENEIENLEDVADDVDEESHDEDDDYSVDVLPEEEEIYNKFMNAKISLDEKAKKNVSSSLDAKVVEVYGKVGLLLSRYKSGKIPKAFKIIPALKNWEELLGLTSPDDWTPQAVFQATKIFVSNLNSQMSQRFFELILLDRVRRDINENKKLNYHLYMALKKALYKPAAFFKGILLPLCSARDCSLKEAAIIGSVLVKVSIPVLHSAAALMKLAELEYSGANSLFIRYLLDKKYALPYKVIDSLVFHFIQFKHDKRELPVLWHQALLVFCQRYKSDISAEQKDALLSLTKVHSHYQISPEIQRELHFAETRDQIIQDVAMQVN